MSIRLTRRGLIRALPTLVAGNAIAATPVGASAQQSSMPAEVTPPEDLMREHGVLNRVLLVYEAALRKLNRDEPFDVGVISRAAAIVRDFIEGYHERNEEQQIFPRFRRAGQMIELVDVLYQQHQAGRRLTDTVIGLVPASTAQSDDRNKLVGSLEAFVAMYRPHEAREDTDLFPKLRSVVSRNEFDALAEDFERAEQRKFGADGFETMVARVADLEQALGIHDLSRATPT